MSPSNFLKNCRVRIWEGQYAVLQVTELPTDFIAVLKDPKETTVIINAKALNTVSYLKAETNWKMLTFEAVLPFELVGFLAAVSTVLAEAGVSIFALSSYSTDHILVKTDKLEVTQQVLEKLGCVFSN